MYPRRWPTVHLFRPSFCSLGHHLFTTGAHLRGREAAKTVSPGSPAAGVSSMPHSLVPRQMRK